jgi:hypothetical protein
MGMADCIANGSHVPDIFHGVPMLDPTGKMVAHPATPDQESDHLSPALHGSQTDTREAGLKRQPEACPIGTSCPETRIMCQVRFMYYGK